MKMGYFAKDNKEFVTPKKFKEEPKRKPKRKPKRNGIQAMRNNKQSKKDGREAWVMGELGKRFERQGRARKAQERQDMWGGAKRETQEKEENAKPSWFDDNKSALEDMWARAKKETKLGLPKPL